MQEGLNETYYSAGFQHVTTTTGAIYNKFLQWTVQDNITYSKYELMYSMNDWIGPSNSTVYINSSTCYDFNWRGMDFLWRNGARLNYSQPMLHDYIVLLSKRRPVEVDYTDPVWRAQIDTYYESLHLHLHAPWEEWLLFLEDLLLGNKFLYSGGKYWLLEPMRYPYLVKHYAAQPLPGQPSSAAEYDHNKPSLISSLRR